MNVAVGMVVMAAMLSRDRRGARAPATGPSAAAVRNSCGRQTVAASAAAEFAALLRQRVTTDAMMAHLAKLQGIAIANEGNRALDNPLTTSALDVHQSAA